MKDFNYEKYRKANWDNEVLGFIAQLHEFKGKQEMFLRKTSLELEKLTVTAKMQSTKAASALDGVNVTELRLKQLMSDKAFAKNASEQEILGYKNSLEHMQKEFDALPLSAELVMQFCNELLTYLPELGYDMQKDLENLCINYNQLVSTGEIDPLVVIPLFVADFLDLNPFPVAKNRMALLLTNFLLLKNGYVIGKYISIEKILCEDGFNSELSFMKNMFGTIVSAYREFERRMRLLSGKMSAKELVERAVRTQFGEFNKRDIMELCPSIGRASVENALTQLVNEGSIRRKGKGKATTYSIGLYD
ncbi:MAG: hypothetical protein MJ150_01000 [Clostridia bacterium]|nr:hypothetical protein [Clostridia bacterium]